MIRERVMGDSRSDEIARVGFDCLVDPLVTGTGTALVHWLAPVTSGQSGNPTHRLR